MSGRLFYRTVLDDGGYHNCAQCGSVMVTGDAVVAAELTDGLSYCHEDCIQKTTPQNWRKELKYLSRDEIKPAASAEVAEFAGTHTFGGEMSLLSKDDADRIAGLADHAQRERQLEGGDVVRSDRRKGGKVLLAGQPACAQLTVHEQPAPVKLRNHAKAPRPTKQEEMLDRHFEVLQYLRAHEGTTK